MAKRELTSKEREALAAKLDSLVAPARSKKIFRSCYGLSDGISKSNAEVGKRFKITGEAVRQTVSKIEALLEK